MRECPRLSQRRRPLLTFYKGNLRSGQVLESYSNITLIGDVNPGAKIISHGSIVILGSLKGNACAGAAGAVRGGPVPGGGYTYGADPGHRAAAAKVPCRRAAVLLSGYDRRRDGRGAWHTRGRCVSAAPARAAAVEKRNWRSSEDGKDQTGDRHKAGRTASSGNGIRCALRPACPPEPRAPGSGPCWRLYACWAAQQRWQRPDCSA